MNAQFKTLADILFIIKGRSKEKFLSRPVRLFLILHSSDYPPPF